MLAAALSIGQVPSGAAAPATTLDEVRERGLLRCGVVAAKPGLALRAADGAWSGFNVDFCRALAAAILPDEPRVEIVATIEAPQDELAAGDVDLLAGSAASSDGLSSGAEARFTAALLIEGQGLMVAEADGIDNARGLNDQQICLADDPDTAGRLRDFAARLQITITERPHADFAAAADAFFAGDCAGLTGPRIALAAARAAQGGTTESHRILPELLSKEPYGPLVRADDQQWLEIVRWTAFALIEAEERDVTAANATTRRAARDDPATARFLGAAGNIGASLELSDDWVVRAVEAVGNYGEIYARNLGADSPLKLERGPNDLWLKGGLLQAMPFQ